MRHLENRHGVLRHRISAGTKNDATVTLSPHVVHSGADPDAHAGVRDGGAGVVISAVDVVVLYREPWSWAIRAPQQVPDARRTRIVPTENDRCESRARPPKAHELGSIGETWMPASVPPKTEADLISVIRFGRVPD